MKNNETNYILGIFAIGMFVIFVLILILALFTSLYTGISMYNPNIYSGLSEIYKMSFVILAVLFLFIGLMLSYFTKNSKKQSIVSKDNTLKYDDPNNNRNKILIDLTNIDEYLNKHKQMIIIDDLILTKNDYRKLSSYSNLLIVDNKNNKEYRIGDLYSKNSKKYNKICAFLDKISNLSSEEIYWHLKNIISNDIIINNGNDLIDKLRIIRSNIEDEEIKGYLSNIINSTNKTQTYLDNVSSNEKIRRLYDNYLPMLIKICENYEILEHDQTDVDSLRKSKDNLIETFNMINSAYSSIFNEKELNFDSLDSEVKYMDEVLLKQVKEVKNGLK